MTLISYAYRENRILNETKGEISYIPKNNPRYPPTFPIKECTSTSLVWVMTLTSSGYEITKSQKDT